MLFVHISLKLNQNLFDCRNISVSDSLSEGVPTAAALLRVEVVGLRLSSASRCYTIMMTLCFFPR